MERHTTLAGRFCPNVDYADFATDERCQYVHWCSYFGSKSRAADGRRVRRLGQRSTAWLWFLWQCERLYSVLSGWDNAPGCRRTEPSHRFTFLLVPGSMRVTNTKYCVPFLIKNAFSIYSKIVGSIVQFGTPYLSGQAPGWSFALKYTTVRNNGKF